NPTDITYGAALGATQLNATASVPGTFTYTPAAGQVLSAGSNQALTVHFVPTDVANYTTPTDTTVHINVLTATPTVAWSNPADITYGTALSATQLNATANVAGTFTYSPAAGAALNAGSNQALTAHFVPDDASNYDLPSDTTVHINVLKATASVTPHDASKTYGADDPTFTGSVTGFLAADGVTVSYSRAAGETVAGGPHTTSVTLSPPGGPGEI